MQSKPRKAFIMKSKTNKAAFAESYVKRDRKRDKTKPRDKARRDKEAQRKAWQE